MEKRKIKLVTNESFGDLTCSFYRLGDTRDLWLTREQIGKALEYEYPRNAIMRIHTYRPDRLDRYSACIPLENDSLECTWLYSHKGIIEICRWCNMPNADQFIDFVWDVMDKVAKNEAGLSAKDASGDLTAQYFEERIPAIEQSLAQISSMQQDIKKDASFIANCLRSQQYSGYDRDFEAEVLSAISSSKILREEFETILSEALKRCGISPLPPEQHKSKLFSEIDAAVPSHGKGGTAN